MAHINKKEIIDQLVERGIDPAQVKDLHLKLQLGKISYDSYIVSKDRLSVPQDTEFSFYQNIDFEVCEKLGIQSLQKDELLVFWLNGGAATRYFDESKISSDEKKRFARELDQLTPEVMSLPKGVTPVLDNCSYLELKIKNLLRITEKYSLEKHPQVLLMNSFLTNEPTKEHLEKLFAKYPKLIPNRFHFLEQRPKLPRFAKVKNLQDVDLFLDQKGHLSFAPAGHGDFLYLTKEYLAEEKIKNAQYMFFSNIDNFGSYIDPVILGYHILHQKKRTVEVALKTADDKGGAPCLVDGQMQIVEQMKFPPDFSQEKLKYFNTNNFWFTLQALLSYEEELPLIIAEKNINEGEVIQIEHFACDVNLPSVYLVVPRIKRFWPTKRYVDLLLYQKPQPGNINEQKISQSFLQLIKNEF